MDGLLLFWIALFLMLILCEAATPSLFFFFSGAIGALSSMAFYLLGFDFSLQALSFFITSVSFLIALKYALKTMQIFKTQHNQKTNYEALIGKKGYVIEPIKPIQRGYIKVEGQLWAAENINAEEISINQKVEIVAVSGAHVKVKCIKL